MSSQSGERFRSIVGTIWWSQLFGQRIGRLDPTTGEITAWKPPFYGPRRLRVGADGIVWVPGYGSGVLGRFDPTIERWKVYDLPTGPPGPPGYGNAEEPYALNANRKTGDVWITGSASDTGRKPPRLITHHAPSTRSQ